MTLYCFIYIIGCGVAYLMTIVGLIMQEQYKGVEPKVFSICLISLIPAFLSWGLPIWWLCYHFFCKRRINK